MHKRALVGALSIAEHRLQRVHADGRDRNPGHRLAGARPLASTNENERTDGHFEASREGHAILFNALPLAVDKQSSLGLILHGY